MIHKGQTVCALIAIGTIPGTGTTTGVFDLSPHAVAPPGRKKRSAHGCRASAWCYRQRSRSVPGHRRWRQRAPNGTAAYHQAPPGPVTRQRDHPGGATRWKILRMRCTGQTNLIDERACDPCDTRVGWGSPRARHVGDKRTPITAYRPPPSGVPGTLFFQR